MSLGHHHQIVCSLSIHHFFGCWCNWCQNSNSRDLTSRLAAMTPFLRLRVLSKTWWKYRLANFFLKKRLKVLPCRVFWGLPCCGSRANTPLSAKNKLISSETYSLLRFKWAIVLLNVSWLTQEKNRINENSGISCWCHLLNGRAREIGGGRLPCHRRMLSNFLSRLCWYWLDSNPPLPTPCL